MTVAAPTRLSHRLQFLLLRAARTLASVLPEGVVVRLGASAGWLAGSVLRIRRGDVESHLKVAFPDESGAWRRRIARGCYVHLGREAVVALRMRRWTREQVAARVRLVGFEAVWDAAEGGEGVVLLTAHHGNWEVAGAGLAAAGFPLDVVAKGMSNRRVERDLFEIRARLGMGMIQMGDASKEVLRSLRRGRVIALLGDQNAHRNGVFVPFFGKPAATLRGTALFAIRTGAPVFVGYAVRQPGWKQRYVLAATRLEYESTGDVETDTNNLLRAYHAHLERAIRAAPEQYFWHHRRWKTRPPQEQASSR